MLCQLLGRAIVLVREDQLSLAIGRRGQNVRLASKLVGWDIEIMTSEELDELIEKAVVGFTQIEGIDTGLAEKLVEQGILSYDDLSVMEIVDLVNTIEDLTEETAIAIVSRAEVLAEEQADDMPRRKGARPVPPPSVEPAVASEKNASLAELFSDSTPDPGPSASTADQDDESTAGPGESPDPMAEVADLDAEVTDLDAEEEDLAIRDLEVAEEVSQLDDDGGEVTSAPSDADQEDLDQIMIDAVESNESATVLDIHEMGDGPNSPEPFLNPGSSGSAVEPPAGADELNTPDDPDDFLPGSREP